MPRSCCTSARPCSDPTTLLVAVSQSGESAEVVRIVDRVRSGDAPPIVVASRTGPTTPSRARPIMALDTRAGVETGPSTMTFAGALVTVAGVGRVLAGAAPRTRVHGLGARGRDRRTAIERLLVDPRLLPDELADVVRRRRRPLVILGARARTGGRGDGRAHDEGGRRDRRSSRSRPRSSGTGRWSSPGRAWPPSSSRPSRRPIDLDVGARGRAHRERAARVLLVTEDGGEPFRRALGSTTGADRPGARAGGVGRPSSCWRGAWRAFRGREPGSYVRASKVTTRE